MKKKTLKQSLVDRMIAEGNRGIRYTDVIIHIKKLWEGKEEVEYNWKKDRGISGTNLSFSSFAGKGGGYLVNGSGKCGLYCENKKWYAKYFTQEEMDSRKRFLKNRRDRYKRITA